MKRKIFFWAAIVVCVAVFAVSLSQIILGLTEYGEGASAYNELRKYATPVKTVRPEETEPVESEEPDSDTLVVDFDSLLEINSQCVGWIYSEGTEINHPIAQTSDNAYYLKHMFGGGYNSSGCIFLDCKNQSDFSDFNSIIYGHNMKNGTMFSSITGYRKQSYYEEHPVMLLMTPEQDYEVLLFSGYVATVEDNAWQVSFADDEARAAWLEDICGKSDFKSDVVPEVTDRILTLSTCSYEFQNARYVLFGVLREVQEDAETIQTEP